MIRIILKQNTEHELSNPDYSVEIYKKTLYLTNSRNNHKFGRPDNLKTLYSLENPIGIARYKCYKRFPNAIANKHPK